MANTKVTKAVLADDAVGLAQLDITNDPSNGQALTYVATSNDLQWANMSGGVDGISSSADATAIYINSSEQVSIGTSSPDSLFHVESSSNTAITIQAGTNSSASLRLKNDAVDWDVNCQTNDNFAIYSQTASAERLVIDSSGFVGFGGATPSSYNSYADNLVVADSAHCGISIVAGNTSQSTLMFADGTGGTAGYRGRVGYDHNADDMVFHTSAADRMRITSGGTLLVGATSLDSPSNAGTLELVGKSTQDGTIRLKADSSKGSEQSHVHYGSNGNWYIRPSNVSSGYVYVRNYQAESDQRLKHNIEDITYGTAEILQLRPRKFSWIGGDTEQNGFVAQEVESVIPAFVKTGEMKINEDDEEGIKSVDYNSIVAALVKTIQELETRIETLENA